MPADTVSANRLVATWLLICCGLVFAMVVLGGVTRLTGSGLSIVEWRPVTGILPPLSDQAWQDAFEQYRQSPEFRQVNSHMDVHDFKGIFWLEYVHRLLGRTIGMVFMLPFLVFLWKGYIQRRELPKYLLMFVLGGLQGVLGWYMVKSGLVENPHVSHYRLTAHLVAAFLIYAYMFWVALSLLYPQHGQAKHPWYRRTVALTALVSLTIVSGALVAGLKAGKIYNTFPMMGDYWLPPGMLSLQPAWRNVLDNLATVQFDHRLLAVSTFVLILVYWFSRPACRFAGAYPQGGQCAAAHGRSCRSHSAYRPCCCSCRPCWPPATRPSACCFSRSRCTFATACAGADPADFRR